MAVSEQLLHLSTSITSESQTSTIADYDINTLTALWLSLIKSDYQSKVTYNKVKSEMD